MTSEEKIEKINEKIETLNCRMYNLETELKILSVSTGNMNKSLDKIVAWKEEEKEKGNKTVSKTGWLIYGGIITSIFSIIVAFIVHAMGV